MKIKILFIWEVNNSLKAYISSELENYLEKLELIFIEPYSEEKANNVVANVDMIIGWRPKIEFLIKAEKAKLFNNPGAGVQHLITIFREINQTRSLSPLLLANCHGNSYFTAQHAVAMLLCLMNRIIIYDKKMRNGDWRPKDLDPNLPLRNYSIGLLGYGAINKRVHKFLSGFQVEVSILKRKWTSSEKKAVTHKVTTFETSQLAEFLKKITILIIAIPLTKQTTRLITRKQLD